MRLDILSQHKRGLAQYCIFTFSLSLFTSLILSHVIFSEQSHDSLHGLDEEIVLEPNHDYEKTSVEREASQIAHEKSSNNFGVDPGKRQSMVQIFDQNDPFAVTFEDYLREASQNSAHHINYDERESHSSTAIPDRANLIIEDEDDNQASQLKQKESQTKIDYIFPAPRKQDIVIADKHETTRRGESGQIDDEHTSFTQLQNEIKLLFGWKQLPTSKCSKPCGKGFKLNHFSCVDLKYDVRVEDELCIKSNISKPNELSDEVCNEIDCPLKTMLVEFQECNPNISQEGICHPNLYKRLQCTMVDKRGVLVYIDNAKCNTATENINSITETKGIESKKDISNRVQIIEDDVSFEELLENNEKNEILPGASIDFGNMDSYLLGRGSKNHPLNEPFFDLGPWSQCSGAPCGQVGKRTRKVSCRLFLSRSSKLVELPSSKCRDLRSPDTEEPCYIDCPDKEASNSTDYKFNNSDNGDEIVYDVEMTRFVWKNGGYTKCSADCLGGKRESIIECWDKEAETAVDPSSCDSGIKPPTSVETCNDVPCQPEWKVGLFSECTKSCGSGGLRTRSVACTQQVPSNNGINYMVVSNDLCIQTNGSMPHWFEPCNRFDCKPQWDVGPWSTCNRICGYGVKNRTVVCVQEFASKNGPKLDAGHKLLYEGRESDLFEAVSISSKDWYPGKNTQVPSRECYEEYKTIPAWKEKCFSFCDNEPYIDADPVQNYQMSDDSLRRRTVTIKIGGIAQIMDGKNLKVRCRILNRQSSENLVNKNSNQVQWHKDGVLIFPNGSLMADKQYIPDDNSIYGDDIIDEKNQYMSDDPTIKKVTRQGLPDRIKGRNLSVRSWSDYQRSYSEGKFSFVPQKGRFSLIKENTLRIKKLRADDSGTYTCKFGALNESLTLKVTTRRGHLDLDEGLTNHLG